MTPSSTPERFWQQFDRSGECWLWTGYINPGGYGEIGWHGRHKRTHRVAWELTYGPIPDGLWVLHDCPGGDDTACGNPAHLWLGTNADNIRDCVTKGRNRNVIADANRARGACSVGHRYTAESSSVNKDGSRNCLICRRERYRQKYREQNNAQIRERYHRLGREAWLAAKGQGKRRA